MAFWIRKNNTNKRLDGLPSAYPSRRVTYNDTNVEAELDAINSNITEIKSNVINTSGSVSLQNYTSSNPYVFPKDGYLRIAAKGSSSYVSVGLLDANGTYISQQSAFGNSQVNEYVNTTVSVKKGMKGYVEYYNNQISTAYFPFT